MDGHYITVKRGRDNDLFLFSVPVVRRQRVTLPCVASLLTRRAFLIMLISITCLLKGNRKKGEIITYE